VDFIGLKNKKIKLTNHKDTWIDTFTKDKFFKNKRKSLILLIQDKDLQKIKFLIYKRLFWIQKN
jgi:hypothetical protein